MREGTDDAGKVDHRAVLDCYGEPVKMKLQSSGTLGHRCTVTL